MASVSMIRTNTMANYKRKGKDAVFNYQPTRDSRRINYIEVGLRIFPPKDSKNQENNTFKGALYFEKNWGNNHSPIRNQKRI